MPGKSTLATQGAAHDIGNALATITSAVSLLREPHDRALQDRLLGAIERSALCAGVIARSLSLGGTCEAAGEVFDLNEQLAKFTELESACRGGECRLELDLAERPCPVSANRLQFESMLLNLVLNAREAMQGRGTIRIRTRRAESGVWLLVADDGHGMTPDVRARAMKPYFTTKAHAQGGLGLAQVHRFVRHSGGTIRIRSAAGRGTVVALRLAGEGSRNIVPSSLPPRSHG